MNTIEQLIPGVSLSGTLFYVYGNIVTQALGAKVKPINGLLIGSMLLLTAKKIIESAVDRFGNDNMKSTSKLSSWLIAPAITTGILTLAGILTTASQVAIIVAIVSSVFFHYQKQPLLMNSKFTFASIAGMEAVKEQLSQEVIIPIRNRALCAQYQVSYPRGVLLYGPPGCGKTLFAQALAGELNLPFLSVTAGEVASPYLHGTTGKIHAIFKKAISQSPCVLFMDEIDGMAFKRQDSSSPTYHPGYNEQIAELITQIDKAIAANVIIIGATNLIQLLDPAIARNGRFDTKIEISRPDDTSRHRLFELYLENRPTRDIRYDELVARSRGYSCSDIKTMVETAAKRALAQSLRDRSQEVVPITMAMF